MIRAGVGHLGCALAIAMIAATASGCGPASRSRHAQDGNTSASQGQTSAKPDRTSNARPTDGAAKPPNPPRSIPTRLVGGPLVFRLQDALRPTPGDDTPQLRYVVVFRLNRRITLPARLKNSRHGPYPPGAIGPFGNFSLNGERFLYDNPIYAFDPVDRTNDRDNCFLGEVRADDPSIHALDKIPVGGHVTVRLRPLTPRANTAVLGITYLRHPPITSMRVRPDTETGYSNEVASRTAARQLAAIGCHATVLDPAG